MRAFARITLCALFALGQGAVHAQNVNTLEKIRSSKAATMGVRDSAAPLSYAQGNGQYLGYHVELCRKILEELQPGLRISYVPVTSANRVALVKNGSVDLECGSTTNTDARQRDVSFAFTTYIAEIRMAVKKDSGLQSIAQLNGKPVVTTTGGTGVPMLRKQERLHNAKYDILMGRDHADSFLLLESGRAEAFVLDDNVLAGLIALARNPQDFVITGESMSVDPNAIMLPKNDPAFKAAVDGILARMMGNGELAALYDKWFMRPIPPRGVAVNLPMGDALKKAFAQPNDRSSEEINQ
jgi:glutamate/aspartate transport system substrate-binding protein